MSAKRNVLLTLSSSMAMDLVAQFIIVQYNTVAIHTASFFPALITTVFMAAHHHVSIKTRLSKHCFRLILYAHL